MDGSTALFDYDFQIEGTATGAGTGSLRSDTFTVRSACGLESH